MRTYSTASAWPARPSLGRTGTLPVGIKPLVLIVILLCAIAVHAGQRTVLKRDVTLRPGPHGDIVGRARVIDGDTIEISGTHIRLMGIDAPESVQSCTDAGKRTWLCGLAATRALKGYVAGRQLACRSSGRDRYRRVLAVCALPDGADVNAWLVRQGWALAYGFDSAYRAEEAEAHAAKRGIWTGAFMAPWDWRHRRVD